jgi:phage terminase large subunit-like protein
MRQTAPLSPDFEADIDRFLPVLQRAWKTASGFELAAWQVDVLRRATELYGPDHARAGQLRFRHYLCSIPRQNGKSELAAAFSLYGILRDPAGAYVVGVARSVEQANLVYERAAAVIRANPALKSRFVKVTETRGLRLASGGRYQMKAGKSASLQGVPVSAAVVDEVHLLPRETWDALTAGTGGRANTVVLGITTAGSDDSALLLDLYDLAERSFRGELERFGATIFEAPEARVPDDDETLAEYIRIANPSVEAGYKDVDAIVSDVRTLPTSEATRYILNRFSASSSGFLDLNLWANCSSIDPFPEAPAVVAIDRTTDWSAATVAAAVRKDDGSIATELIAWPKNPTLDRLEALSVQIWRTGKVSTFAIDGYSLKDLGARLKARGFPVRMITAADVYQAPSTFYAVVARKRLSHGGDPLLTVQLPRAATKASGEAYRIVRGPTHTDIDAVIATVNAVYVAETSKEQPLQVF